MTLRFEDIREGDILTWHGEGCDYMTEGKLYDVYAKLDGDLYVLDDDADKYYITDTDVTWGEWRRMKHDDGKKDIPEGAYFDMLEIKPKDDGMVEIIIEANELGADYLTDKCTEARKHFADFEIDRKIKALNEEIETLRKQKKGSR